MTNIAIFTGNINGEPVQTVNARDLHKFLEVKTAFRDWIARRIADYGFEDGKDFCSFLSETPSGGRPAREYHISLDMAKELSMVERNQRGKEARQYFIECEKRAKGALSALRPINEMKEVRLQMQRFHWLAKQLGLKGTQAVLSANHATLKATGFDMMGALGVTHADAPQNEALLTATEVGRRCGIGSAQKVNQTLCERGLQQSFRDAKGRVYYEPTKAGEAAGGIMQDTGKKNRSGTPVRQLKWSSGIIDLLGGEHA